MLGCRRQLIRCSAAVLPHCHQMLLATRVALPQLLTGRRACAQVDKDLEEALDGWPFGGLTEEQKQAAQAGIAAKVITVQALCHVSTLFLPSHRTSTSAACL